MELPDKPSALIRVALADLQAVEADERYKVEMGHWHMPQMHGNQRGPCLVCLAGAVMANTLGVAPHRACNPSDFDKRTELRLWALDELRLGNVRDAFYELLPDEDPPIPDRRIVPYDELNRELFHRQMEELAADLERVGH